MSPSFELARVSGQPAEDAELIADMKSIAATHGTSKLTQLLYREFGHYADTTISRRFGGWNAALTAAGLDSSNELNLSNEKLFENLLELWQHYGRQPRRSELARPPSFVSQSPYNRRFGSWTAALEQFVAYANSTEIDCPSTETGQQTRAATPRDPSLRLRWRVLQRDRFRCRACGTSPAVDSSVNLHVDHITPWSVGGQTIIENLQTLCDKCNLGKSNLRDA
jgi:5-methylcytosine-specific restriction endonuclease McrA